MLDFVKKFTDFAKKITNFAKKFTKQRQTNTHSFVQIFIKNSQKFTDFAPKFFIFMAFFAVFALNSNALTSFDLHNINAAHAQGYTGKGVNIGIVDGKFNAEHELLRGKFLTPPINNTYNEKLYHANHVAGIAAGATTNAESYGIAYDSKLVGYGNLGISNYNTGFNEILTYNVRVINNSHTAFHRQFVDFARQDNSILIVYASGNDGALTPTLAAKHGTGSAKSGTNGDGNFPDTYYNLGAWLAVGNINPSYVSRQNDGSLSVGARAVGGRSASTNLCQGATAYCLMAAGTDIVSAGYENGSLMQATGTSMAAPLVTGVAAILAQKFPFLEGKQLADVLLSTANSTFATPKVIYKYNTSTFLYDILYIDSEIPTNADGSHDKTQILADLRGAYTTFSDSYYASSNVSKVSKEDVFGQGIVDATAALRGLAVIDINRLGSLDTQSVNGKTYAFYTLDTKGFDATFENDISQKKWDAKYQNSSVQTLIGATMAALDAGFLKKGDGTLSVSGNLLYKGATLIEQGELRLIAKNASVLSGENPLNSVNFLGETKANSANSVNFLEKNSQNQANSVNFSALSTLNSANLQVTNDIFVKPNGTLSTDTNVDITGSLTNEGVLKVGVTGVSALNVSQTYTQTPTATLKLAINAGANAANSTLSATNYNIQSGAKLIYTPLSASATSRRVELNLLGLENELSKFGEVSLDNSSYTLKYTLLDDNKTLIIASSDNAYANFNGANESLAALLRTMSEANINSDYTAFFEALNAANQGEYEARMKALSLRAFDDKAWLRQSELVLLLQGRGVLESVLFGDENEGWGVKPHYLRGSSGSVKSQSIGTRVFANSKSGSIATSVGLDLDYLNTNYESLSSESGLGGGTLSEFLDGETKASSKVLNAYFAAKMPYSNLDFFGGVGLGAAFNKSEKGGQRADFNDYLANAWGGVALNIGLGDDFYTTNIAPTAFLSYTFLRQGEFDDGDSGLFATKIHAFNANFISANAGVNFTQKLANALNANAYAFYERRILGDKISTKAEFKDFAGQSFTQDYALSPDIARFGVALNYTKQDTKDFVATKAGKKVRLSGADGGFFATLGLEAQIALTPPQKSLNTANSLTTGFAQAFSLNDNGKKAKNYTSFGANLKIGFDF